MSQFKCVTFAEGDMEGTFTFDTAEELKGFMKGVGVGSSYYSAGSCGAYDLEELQEMLEDETNEDRKEQLKRAIEELKE